MTAERNKYHYEKRKLTKSRFEWLISLPEPFNKQAIAAVKYVKGDKHEAFLEEEKASHNSVSVLMDSILFIKTSEGVNYWLSACYEMEKMMKIKNRTKLHI